MKSLNYGIQRSNPPLKIEISHFKIAPQKSPLKND